MQKVVNLKKGLKGSVEDRRKSWLWLELAFVFNAIFSFITLMIVKSGYYSVDGFLASYFIAGLIFAVSTVVTFFYFKVNNKWRYFILIQCSIITLYFSLFKMNLIF